METIPNHIKNVIKFKNLKRKEDIDIILEMIARPLYEGDTLFRPDRLDYVIDFDKIIPEPQEESECPEGCKVNKDSHIIIEKDRPWFDWYRWHIAFWGTKWNAYDGYTELGKNSITFVFNTAWSRPEPVIAKLALLGYDIDVKYADEDLGHDCGAMTYRVNSGWDSKTEDDYKDPRGFARRLWDNY